MREGGKESKDRGGETVEGTWPCCIAVHEEPRLSQFSMPYAKSASIDADSGSESTSIDTDFGIPESVSMDTDFDQNRVALNTDLTGVGF